MQVKNIFSFENAPWVGDQEQFQTLCSDHNLRIERIISRGHTTQPDQWYDQPENEWVLLLQGKASLQFENSEMLHLTAGDYIFLPSGLKHRVAFTSKNPPCIWLAIHFK